MRTDPPHDRGRFAIGSGSGRVSPRYADAEDRDSLAEAFRGVRMVVNVTTAPSLPGQIGRAALNSDCDYLHTLVSESTPPDEGVVMACEASATKDERNIAVRITAEHDDTYLFTVVSVVACLKQCLDGAMPAWRKLKPVSQLRITSANPIVPSGVLLMYIGAAWWLARYAVHGSAKPLVCRAIVAQRHGGPEVLAVREWPVPQPGRGEVRLRVEAAGISYADLLMVRGLHPERRRSPFVPGWDVVGTVDAVGTDVRQVAVGDRVAALPIVGGWAEYAVVPAKFAVPVPRSVDPVAAVCLVMDYIVAYQMLTRGCAVRAGDTVLVQGVGGAVGTALMQVARLRGVRVLGTDREGKRSHVESQGGTLIDFAHEDVVSRCRELTGGRGVDVVFDGIGATAQQSLRALRPGGRLIWFGMVTLPSARGRTLAGVTAALTRNLWPGGKRTSLYSIQTLARRHPQWYRHDLAALLELLDGKQIDPQIAARWTLDQVPEALSMLARGALTGKQVIAASST